MLVPVSLKDHSQASGLKPLFVSYTTAIFTTGLLPTLFLGS